MGDGLAQRPAQAPGGGAGGGDVDGTISLGSVGKAISGVLFAITQQLGSFTKALTHRTSAAVSVGSADHDLALGDSAVTMDGGSTGSAITGFLAALVQSVGFWATALGGPLGSLLVGSGALDASLTTSDIGGVETRSAGLKDLAITVPLAVLAAQPAGSNGQSQLASLVGLLTKYATTVIESVGTGWTAPTSAEGAPDAVVAILTQQSSGTISGTLRATALWLPVPGFGDAGFTVTRVDLVVRHRLDTTVTPVVSSASAEISIQKVDGTGTTSVYLSTDLSGPRNDGALVTDTFDITSAVSAWTAGQIAGMRVHLIGAFTIAAVAGGNALWNVDAVAVRFTVSRTGVA